MSLPEGFDYHLTPTERNQVERCVPLHQAKIHLAFRAIYKFEGKSIVNGAIALSEHMITFCTPGFLRLTLRSDSKFHIFSIKSIDTIDDNTAEIRFSDAKVTITSTVCMKFIRNTLRNFILSNPALPSNLRFKFSCHDTKFFPPFIPELSPSQMFQFTYNAYCSYLDTTYYHDIPRYFHRLLETGSCIFDLTKLPLKILECGLGDAADIKPITSALTYLPFIFGFTCENFVRPDIIEAISPLVRRNQALRIVRVVDAGAETGALSLGNAMLRSKNQGIIYWDLSKNKLEDMQAFTQALGKYDAEVKAIRLNDCDMSDMAVASLFQSLDENESLYYLEELTLVGSRVISSNCEIFCQYLEDIIDDSQRDPSLKVLGLSFVEDPEEVIVSLDQSNVQLVSFEMTDTTLNESTVEALCRYIKKQRRMEKFSIDNCAIPIRLLCNIIKEFGRNNDLLNIKFSFNNLEINDDSFDIVMEALLDNVSLKMTGLSLDNNQISVKNVITLGGILSQFTQLKTLSLSKNFSSSMRGIGSALCGLLKSPFLENITIQGDESHKLKDELIEFICCLQSTSIKSLDISFNAIGDFGLETLTNLIVVLLTLNYVAADGSEPKSFETIDKFLYIVETSPQLFASPLPVEDIYYNISELNEETQSRYIETITRHQLRLDSTLMKNRISEGLRGDLVIAKDPILDEIVDEATLALSGILEKFDLNKHLAITEIVGLPLPFEEDKIEKRTLKQEPVGDGKNSYVKPEMMQAVYEKVDFSLEQLKTLQFNSLLIRRPNAAERLANKAALFINPPKDDNEYSYSDSYDEDDDDEGSKKKKKLAPTKMEMIAPAEFDKDEE